VEESNYQIMASLYDKMNEFVKRKNITLTSPSHVTSPLIVKLKNPQNYLQKKWSKDRNAINWVNLVRASRRLKTEVKKVRSSQIYKGLKRALKNFVPR